jgi:hypothetical protein
MQLAHATALTAFLLLVVLAAGYAASASEPLPAAPAPAASTAP